MSAASPAPTPARPARLLWPLLGAMVLVGLLPLVISHYFLIGINRDSLETLEKKYLTRSAVSIATDVQTTIASSTQQLAKIAASMRAMKSALPPGSDPFTFAAQSNVVADYITPDGGILGLRILDRNGHGAEAVPPNLDRAVVEELDLALVAAAQGQPYTGTFQTLTALNQPAVVVAVPVIDNNQVLGTVEGIVSLRPITERIREDGKGDVMKAPQRLTESYDETRAGRPTTMLGTVAPVIRPDWGVVVEKPERSAFASVAKMIKATVSWGSLALALAIAAAVLFAARIARPIHALADRTQEIANGSYGQHVEVKARNEIGTLADNFNVMSSAIGQAIEQRKKAAHENNLLFINSVRMLAAAIDAKDPYTRGHSERVARYSIGIGKNLGLSDKEMRNLRISALLRDVGKIGIDDRILRKPGALNDDEFEVMKQHPAKGAAIMSGVAQLIDIIPGMKYHHEKWSGGGYPDSLEAEQILMQARIVVIADTFDAMTTNRPYQKAMELGYVVEKIKSFAGTRFDPRVVEAFVQAVKRGDIQIEEQVRGAA